MSDDVYTPPSYASISPLPPEWLWRPYVPYGTVTGLFGAEGIAKGFLESMIAAIITKGSNWPNEGDKSDKGSVIMVMTEDDPNLTMAYRLRAAGADLSKVHDMTEVDGTDFQLPQDVPKLREAIASIGNVRLVVIDALGDASSIGLTSSVKKVRQMLTNPLKDLARDTGVAIILTQHTTKDGKKLQGSAAIRQALRHVLRVERDPNNPLIRTVSIDKSNIANDSSASNLHYTLEGEGQSTRVKFLGADSDNAEDVTWHDYTDSELESGWSREAGQSGIVKALSDAYPRTMRAGDLAAKTGLTWIAARVLLSKLSKHGDVKSDGSGNWTLGDKSEAS